VLQASPGGTLALHIPAGPPSVDIDIDPPHAATAPSPTSIAPSIARSTARSTAHR